jgi:hypothetical protein
MGGTVRYSRMSQHLIAFAIALVALAVMASSASAETTRADWVAQADAVCASGQAQDQALLAPVRKAGRKLFKERRTNRKVERRFKRVFRNYFIQYAAVQRAVDAQIATIPPAPEDVSLVQVWLRARGELADAETTLFTGRKKQKTLNQVFGSIYELFVKQLEINDLVRDFGFQHCNQGNPEIEIIA